jgi:hypothetical protein
MKQTPNAAGRKFHFMVAAQIVFSMPADDGGLAINTANINGVVTHDKDTIPTHLLGQAQKVAQMQLFKRLGDEATKVNVIDVVITNLMNLGYMTEAEFNAAPDGQKQQEIPKAAAAHLRVVGGGEEVVDPFAVVGKATVQ